MDGAGYQGLRTLVVDDEKFIRVLLTRMLQELGVEVVATAASGAEAVRLCRELRPDLVTLDIAMPDGDGLSALREICAFDPGITVLMSTAFDDTRHVAEALRAGARGYLVKPFDVAGIHGKLTQLFPIPKS
jgi:two-component system chemotaxis response regulator CheY